MKARLLALAALVAASSTTMAAPPADLGAFLSGFETRCSGPAAFIRYRDSLGDRYTSSGSLQNKVVLPPGLEEAFGRETVVDKGEYVSVTVPLAGTYKGLAVKQLEFDLGNENGIYTVALVFAAPFKDVWTTLGPRIGQARKGLDGEFPDRHPAMELRRNRGTPRLSCNLSG